MKTAFALSVIMLFSSTISADNTINTTSPDNAEVYFIAPADGEQIAAPVTIKFGLKGMGGAPAGVAREDTGHHHLIINLEELPDLTMPLPASDQVRHFGKGQTETTIDLAPGQHTLRLILGNQYHIPHNPPVISEEITITVIEE